MNWKKYKARSSQKILSLDTFFGNVFHTICQLLQTVTTSDKGKVLKSVLCEAF